METILITGGAGFIGQLFAKQFANNNYNIITVDLKNITFSDQQIKHYCIDITTNKLEQVFIENKIDYVIHLAANISVNKSINNPEYDATQNILGTLNLIKYCKKYDIKKIIAASTAAIYGEQTQLPITENTPPAPLSPYGISKLAMENYIKISGLNYIIFRYSNIYGKEELLTKENCGVISLFYKKMINNEDIIIFGDGEQTRDFIEIQDVFLINLKALQSDIKNITINFSSAEEISINTIYKTIAQITNYKKQPQYQNKINGEIKYNSLDNTKAIKLFKISPKKFNLNNYYRL